MKKLGYEKTRTRTGAKYRVHERTSQEIDEGKRAEIAIIDQESNKSTPAQHQPELPF